MNNSNQLGNQLEANKQTEEGKYLTFELGKEEYGIGIMKIKEIIGMMDFTAIPQAPEFVRGLINLRGKIIPIVDLRSRFSMETIDYTERTCIVIVEINRDNVAVLVGLVVDAVCEVLTVKREQLENTPSLGISGRHQFISAMAKVGKKVKMLLEIDRLMESDNQSDIPVC